MTHTPDADAHGRGRVTDAHTHAHAHDRGALRRIVVLGSTGSIGVQALDVLALPPGDTGDECTALRLVGLAAATNWRAALAQASAFDVETVLLSDPDAAAAARTALDGTGSTITIVSRIEDLLDATAPDLVLNAVVGFAGLAATVAALERGIDVALANKESLVAAGELCFDLAERHGARIIPVDSEHSALQQCIAGSEPHEISSLILTASGGPFRGRTRGDLAGVTLAEALDHPTWSMGGKISIDSATLMNKGLELIEAMMLFDLPESRIETIVHPHSIVHALVRHRDGSLLAHLGWPDMRIPIAWALHWPTRPAVPARQLDLADMPALTFAEPDLDTFRCLALARDAARAAGGAPCVLNAANEIAVAAFMADAVPFLAISDIVEETLTAFASVPAPASLDDAIDLDARARAAAQSAAAAAAAVAATHATP